MGNLVRRHCKLPPQRGAPVHLGRERPGPHPLHPQRRSGSGFKDQGQAFRSVAHLTSPRFDPHAVKSEPLCQNEVHAESLLAQRRRFRRLPAHPLCDSNEWLRCVGRRGWNPSYLVLVWSNPWAPRKKWKRGVIHYDTVIMNCVDYNGNACQRADPGYKRGSKCTWLQVVLYFALTTGEYGWFDRAQGLSP